MIGWWLLRWDRLVMRATGEDELCWHPDVRTVDDPGGPGVVREECVRRWSHAGRHVYRDVSV